MSVTQTVPSDLQERLLLGAAAEQRRVVLTHQGTDGWRLYKGRFATNSGRADGLLVLVPAVSHEGRTLVLKTGDVLGCAFRDGHRKCICTTVIDDIRADGDNVLITLRTPEDIQQLQRRAFERAAPAVSNVIAVRFWQDGPGVPSGQSERNVRHGQLVDISAGGMRVNVPDPHRIVMDATYRCVFTTGPGKPAFVLDAFLRHREAEENGRAALGFQFVGLETTTEGRKTLDRLARLVSHFQRHRQRRPKPLA